MTRLLTTGWETGLINEAGGTIANGVAIASSSPAPTAPGQFYIRCNGYVNGGTITFSLPIPKTELWTRCNVWASNAASGCEFIRFQDSTGATQGMLTWVGSDSSLRLWRGESNLQLATSFPVVFSSNQWHLLEVRWNIASLTLGDIEVWVDGTRWFNLLGQDNTGGTVANIQRIVLGNQNYSGTTADSSYFDDFAVNDTVVGTTNNGRIGDGRVVLLKPNGVGSSTQFLRGGTDTGQNWSQLNENPASMTQYVGSPNPGDRDLYALENVPGGTWTVNTIDVVAFARNGDVGTGSIGLTLKSGATINEASAQLLTTTATTYRQTYDVDPNTGTQWTVAGINALEVGQTVR